MFQLMKATTKLALRPVYSFLSLYVNRFSFLRYISSAGTSDRAYSVYRHFCTKKISLGKFLHLRNKRWVLNSFPDGHGELLYWTFTYMLMQLMDILIFICICQ